MPKKDIVKKLITRPRMWSSTRICTSVFEEAICIIMQARDSSQGKRNPDLGGFHK